MFQLMYFIFMETVIIFLRATLLTSLSSFFEPRLKDEKKFLSVNKPKFYIVIVNRKNPSFSFCFLQLQRKVIDLSKTILLLPKSMGNSKCSVLISNSVCQFLPTPF